MVQQKSDKQCLGQKVRIYPNKTMIKQLELYFNYSRYCYNKSLYIWNTMYKNNEKPNFRTVRDNFKNNYKEEWEKEYPPNILDNSIQFLSNGWSLYFKHITRKPKFKSKKRYKPSFTINRKSDSTIRIINNKLYLPKFKYGIKLSEDIKIIGIIKLCTISRKANKYFASFIIELSDNYKKNLYQSKIDNTSVGIDVNIGHFDISEKNYRYDFPLKELKKYYAKIEYYQKRMSRKILEKKNKEKLLNKEKSDKNYIYLEDSHKYLVMKTKLQNLYMRINNIQNDWLHKFTTNIISKYHLIGIETLKTKNMMKCHNLAKSISHSLFYRFRLFIEYKSKLYGNILVKADKSFPSTQKCSCCGNIKKGNEKLHLKDRIYKCNYCKNIMNRDLNSAFNLKEYALDNYMN